MLMKLSDLSKTKEEESDDDGGFSTKMNQNNA